jgi:hypothetical protein
MVTVHTECVGANSQLKRRGMSSATLCPLSVRNRAATRREQCAASRYARLGLADPPRRAMMCARRQVRLSPRPTIDR